MARRLIAGLLAACWLAGVAQAQEPDVLQHLRAGHPRLLVTDAQVKAALDDAKSDPLRAELNRCIIASATQTLGAPDIRHRLIGPRLLDQCRLAVQRITTCAMAYRLTGDTRFSDQARHDLMTVANFPDWNPSHFLDVAEMGYGVALGYDWLYPILTPEERAGLKRALMEKSLVFAPAAYSGPTPKDHRVYWVNVAMNWNQVCNAGLLTAALAVADQEPDVARLVINGVRRSLPKAMAPYQPDGGFPEGPGYWAYGTTYNVIALAEMEETLGTDFGLSHSPAFGRTAFYRLAVEGPTGLGFNYADGGAGMEATPALSWLADRFGPPPAVTHARELLKKEAHTTSRDRWLALYESWFPHFPDGVAPAMPSMPLDVHFRGVADIALFRSAWNDPNALFLGFKGGSNRANHAHLDLGSFVLDADGVRWAEDLGPDDYNLPEYFGAKRWTYFRLNNHSHNTVTPGDLLQNPKAAAPIIAFGTSPDHGFAIVDLTSVYPNASESLRRGIAILDRSRILIQDEWTPSEEWMNSAAADTDQALRWAMATSAKITLSSDGRTAQLSSRGKELEAQILAPDGTRFEVASGRPPTAAEQQNKGVSFLVAYRSPSKQARLAVLLTPGSHLSGQLPPPSIVPLDQWEAFVARPGPHPANLN